MSYLKEISFSIFDRCKIIKNEIMKKTIAILFLIVSIYGSAQEGSRIPAIDVKTLEMQTINTSSFDNEGKPIIISFWATWCKPCVQELSTIAEEYEDWQEETGVKLIAVSIDNSRSTSRVAPFVNGKGWEYDIYLDPNEDFKKAMNVVNIPHTFLVDKDGMVVWEHTSYAVGDEEKMIKVELPEAIDITTLIATFTASENAGAYIDGVEQVSGVTTNDFTDTVYYNIVSESEDTAVWKVVVNQITGIPHLETEKLSIYPNPSTGQLFIDKVDKGTLIVYNLIGKEVLVEEIAEGKNVINISSLPGGTYLVKIYSGKRIFADTITLLD